MSLYFRSKPLLASSSTSTSELVGKPYFILPDQQGLTFRAFVDFAQSSSDSSASILLHLETSQDGHWLDAVDPLLLQGPGELHTSVELPTLGPLIRARTELRSNSQTPYSIQVGLSATGAFQLREKSVTHNTFGGQLNYTGTSSKTSSAATSSSATESSSSITETAAARTSSRTDL